MADVLTWDAVYEQFMQAFAKQDWQAGYDVMTAARDSLPEQAESVDYFRLCALARLGENERLFKMLADKLHTGFWYSEFIMRASPSFAPLQGNPEFERFTELYSERANMDTSDEVLTIIPPQTAHQPYPAIIALHGNQQTSREARDAW